MTIPEALLSGLVQGLTEFFPISSSGHLVLLHSVFRIKEPQVAFDVFLHLGTLAAIIVYFRKDIIDMFLRERSLFVKIVAASIPTFLIAFLLKGVAEAAFGSPRLVGYMLIITGLWLGICSLFYQAVYSMSRRDGSDSPGIFGSIVIGIAQGISVMPGISRSGATISTALLAGVKEGSAFRFSFLAGIPAILGACVFKAAKITSGLDGDGAAYYIWGCLAAVVSGLAAVWILDRMIRKRLFFVFGIYCVAAGAAVVLLNIR